MDDNGDCWSGFFASFSLIILFVLTSCTNKATQQKNIDSANRTNDTVAVIHDTVQQPRSFAYDTTKKYIYLTLDDGPQPGTTNCYHILKQLNIKASFFMIAAQAKDSWGKAKVDSIRNAYPELLLCNHSYTHANYNHYKSYYLHPDSAMRDLLRAQDTLRVPMKIMRTPGNNSWAINGKIRACKLTRPVTRIMDSLGYKIIGWDAEWRFKNGSTPVQNVQQLLNEVNYSFEDKNNFTRHHVVLLAHDRMFQKQQYADSLTKFITLLKNEPGVVFETIDHYPGVTSK